jgi:hypothetical protein
MTGTLVPRAATLSPAPIPPMIVRQMRPVSGRVPLTIMKRGSAKPAVERAQRAERADLAERAELADLARRAVGMIVRQMRPVSGRVPLTIMNAGVAW